MTRKLNYEEMQFLKGMKQKQGMRENEAYREVSKTARTVKINEYKTERQKQEDKEKNKGINFKNEFERLRSGNA